MHRDCSQRLQKALVSPDHRRWSRLFPEKSDFLKHRVSHQSPTLCVSVSKKQWIAVAYLQKSILMSATPYYNPDTSNTGSGFAQVFDKRHGGCPSQELHAQIRKGSLWIFPARLLIRPGACLRPSYPHPCSVQTGHFVSLLANFREFSNAKKFIEGLVHFFRCP